MLPRSLRLGSWPRLSCYRCFAEGSVGVSPPAFDHSDLLSPSELCFCNQFTGPRVQFRRPRGSRRGRRGSTPGSLWVLLSRNRLRCFCAIGWPPGSLVGSLMAGSRGQIRGFWVLHRLMSAHVPGNPSASSVWLSWGLSQTGRWADGRQGGQPASGPPARTSASAPSLGGFEQSELTFF